MLSVIKRFTSKGDAPSNNNGAPPGHQSMSTTLQRKFAKGIQYNMKIIIKGDRNVGKTCLFHRLQGKKFVEEHLPTEEIQVASIQWNYKATDDIVKVEVWDVVDRGKKKKCLDGLKLNNSSLEISEEPALDAEFLDVYKGTNGVILIMDITKSWTFDYVQRELPKIPDHIPVMLLANHCDMSHHRTITQNQISFFVENFQERPAQVRYAESSMRNGFGLKLLHKFFNLPFLQLQRHTLMQQLERNKSEMVLTTQELNMYFDSDEADYCKFVDKLAHKRRQVAELNSPNSMTNVGSNELQTRTTKIITNNPLEITQAGPQLTPTTPSETKRIDATHNSQSRNINMPVGDGLHNTVQSAIKTENSLHQPNVEQSFISKVFGITNKTIEPAGIPKSETDSSIISVEEFCPEPGPLDKHFLDDVEKHDTVAKSNYEAIESDSDGDGINPLVANLEDDLDLDDASSNTSYVYPTIGATCSEFTYNKPTNLLQSSDYNQIQNTIFDDTIETETTNSFTTSYYNNDSVESDLSTCDNWLTSNCQRRSPEGGEDTPTIQHSEYSELNLSNNLICTDSKTPTLKGKKDRDVEKLQKKKSASHKSEKKEKIKKSHGEKKKSKERKNKKNTFEFDEENGNQNELEEFLNKPGPTGKKNSYEMF